MKMVAFYERFGDIAFDEMRTLSVPAGNPVPADEYGYLESLKDYVARIDKIKKSVIRHSEYGARSYYDFIKKYV